MPPMSAWSLDIAIIAPPSDEDGWNRADEIVSELSEQFTNITPRHGAFWTFEYYGEASLEESLADVRGRLVAIDQQAPELLLVGQHRTQAQT